MGIFCYWQLLRPLKMQLLDICCYMQLLFVLATAAHLESTDLHIPDCTFIRSKAVALHAHTHRSTASNTGCLYITICEHVDCQEQNTLNIQLDCP